jgi:hypothetical protein
MNTAEKGSWPIRCRQLLAGCIVNGKLKLENMQVLAQVGMNGKLLPT